MVYYTVIFIMHISSSKYVDFKVQKEDEGFTSTLRKKDMTKEKL
jgi:hypothetical protein